MDVNLLIKYVGTIFIEKRYLFLYEKKHSYLLIFILLPY
jgi:hypothetical protein